MGDLAGATLGWFGGGLLVEFVAVGQVGDGRGELVLDDWCLQLVGAGVGLLGQALRPSRLLSEVALLVVGRLLTMGIVNESGW